MTPTDRSIDTNCHDWIWLNIEVMNQPDADTNRPLHTGSYQKLLI